MTHPSERPLRIAYARLAQAAIAIHMEILEDPQLGGGYHLASILSSVANARIEIERLAAAEGIPLVNEEDE